MEPYKLEEPQGISPGRDVHHVEHNSVTGRVAHEVTQNVPRDVAQALSWEYLFKQLCGRTQPA